MNGMVMVAAGSELAEKIKYRFFNRERSFLRFHPG